MRRHDWALKAGFNPEQPRNEAGEWTDANGNPVAPRRVRLAGDIPTSGLPKIPEEPPQTSRGRTAALKAVARYGGPIGKLIEGAEWIREHSPLIESYRDAPKSLDELQQDVSTPDPGYDIHHIVEQTQAKKDGFTREQIDNAENLVRIPRMKRWEINAWYQTEALRQAGVLKP